MTLYTGFLLHDCCHEWYRYMVDKERDGPLVSMDVKDFILTVGARSPTPGGGSVASLTATLVRILLRLNVLSNFAEVLVSIN